MTADRKAGQPISSVFPHLSTRVWLVLEMMMCSKEIFWFIISYFYGGYGVLSVLLVLSEISIPFLWWSWRLLLFLIVIFLNNP